jgi:RNA exonuclease 1
MSLDHLKHIPCPAGDRCTAFKCLFGHREDFDATPEAAPVPTINAEAAQVLGKDGAQLTALNQDGPRKRLKTEPSVPDPITTGRTTTPVRAKPKPVASAPGDAKLKPSSGTRISTASRQVSPPPLKRKAPLSAESQRKGINSSPSTPSTAARLPTATTPKSESLPITPAKLKAKKIESLNPRLVKASPAQHDLRYKLLGMLHQEYARLNAELKKDANDEEAALLLSEQELIVRALDDEEKAAVEQKSIYANVIKNRIMQYKRMTVLQWKEERTKEKQKAASKKRPDKNGHLGPPKEIDTGLTPAQEVQLVRRLATPIASLSEYGYVSEVPKPEEVEKAKQGLEAAKGWEQCDRCEKRFQVFPGRREEDGALASNGECTHHWGKMYYPEQAQGDRVKQPKRYKCCGQSVGDSPGCTTSQYHVFKVGDPKSLAAVLNFEETPQNAGAPSDRAVCFDCEMCYTVYGLELIRLTATAWPAGEELLDVLVQPLGEILDLNSRYSGVWPEDMVEAEPWIPGDDLRPAAPPTSSNQSEANPQPPRKLKKVASPAEARSLLFSLIGPSTPLIGHGLENDLNTTRIVHPVLIDTILLFPHKRGLPFRYGLKMLMETVLNRQIQIESSAEGKVQGHDSAEDARAAGELVRFKLEGEWRKMRNDGWKLVDGAFVAPGLGVGKEAKIGAATAEDGKLTAEFLESAL